MRRHSIAALSPPRATNTGAKDGNHDDGMGTHVNNSSLTATDRSAYRQCQAARAFRRRWARRRNLRPSEDLGIFIRELIECMGCLPMDDERLGRLYEKHARDAGLLVGAFLKLVYADRVEIHVHGGALCLRLRSEGTAAT